MLTGVAKGGPRDGVKLSAGNLWDGRIALPQKASNSEHGHEPKHPKYYLGWYKWNVFARTWIWHPASADSTT